MPDASGFDENLERWPACAGRDRPRKAWTCIIPPDPLEPEAASSLEPVLWRLLQAGDLTPTFSRRAISRRQGHVMSLGNVNHCRGC